ncbi:MAG: hypothetical protein EBT06_10460 [Gammaproteobacteria bacterium]|jgi:hypothetical protein|nr:hypothetical protein [Gammaproteobacteria bacterium]NBT45320.1 hypothetical protein [Gammaproteobacteria bacterium]
MRYVSDFIGAVEAEQLKIARSLALGNAKSYEAYQYLVGEHQGLAKALEILNNLLKEDDIDDR